MADMQILQNYPKRDAKLPLQKLQILQISQNYPNERRRTPIAEITEIANIAELSKCEIQNPHRNYDNCGSSLSECFIGKV